MRKIVLGITLFMILVFFLLPWYGCATAMTGAQLLAKGGVAQSLGSGNCAPRGIGTVLTAVYLVLTVLICVGSGLTIRQDRGPLWFWIGALATSIAGMVVLFVSTYDVRTDSILIGANLSFFANLALIIAAIVGVVRSVKASSKKAGTS